MSKVECYIERKRGHEGQEGRKECIEDTSTYYRSACCLAEHTLGQFSEAHIYVTATVKADEIDNEHVADR